jgi:CheY-like chemotaxis protein
VDDLLEASRLSRGMIALHTEDLDLRDSLAAALDQSRPQLERTGCRVALELPDHPLPIRADPVRIAQVFTNLLNNAGKYGRPGGRVEVRARARDGTVAVDVVDDGQGIEPALLPRVFELFTQGPRGGNGLREGLGIGLALVRRLVELHGGRVHAHSDGAGRGARFTVELALASDAGQRGSRPPAATVQEIAGGRELRVLVVDDNADAAASLAMVLESTGLSPRVARSGPQALGIAREYRPHVVLLDIGMPQMDGYEVARRLRADPGADPRPLLVAVTGWSHPRDHERCRAAGFDHHFSKPADVPAIVELIESLHSSPTTPVLAGTGT